MKMFYLKRAEDESGVSGTGRVAQGFVFDNEIVGGKIFGCKTFGGENFGGMFSVVSFWW